MDSLDQKRQLSRRQVQRALDDRRPNESPFLQTLGEKTQAGAVSGQNLHVVAAFAAKHERRPRIRVGVQHLRDIRGQPVETAPPVHGLASQIDRNPPVAAACTGGCERR
jgi:hypothetical protein